MSSPVLPPPSKFHVSTVERRVGYFLDSRRSLVVLLAFALAWLPQCLLAVFRDQLQAYAGDWVALGAGLAALAAGLFLQATIVALASASRSAPRELPTGLWLATRAIPKLLPLWVVMIAPVAAQLWLSPHWSDAAALESAALSGLRFGVALAVAFLVGVYPAVAVSEALCFWASLGRTLALMRRGRWRMLGVYCLTQLVILAADGVMFVVRATLFGPDDLQGGAIASGFVSLTIGASVAVWWSVFIAQSYRELTRLAGGPPIDDEAATSRLAEEPAKSA